MYNIYLVIDRDSPPSFIKMINHIAQQIAVASLYEENRCGYITEEISKMFATREDWFHNIQKDEFPDHQELTKNMLRFSSLARTLCSIFHGLNDEGKIKTHINSSFNLDLSTRDIFHHPDLPLRPYQTILLLDQVENILSSLPLDASPSLKLVLQVAKPIKDFNRLQKETGLPLSQLFRIAAHLVYWGKAKVVVFLTKLNVYTLNPNPPIQSLQSYITQFKQDFPSFDFCATLENFSIPKKLMNHMSRLSANLQPNFVNVVSWLLRHDLLVQVHTYVYLICPVKANQQNPFNSSNEKEIDRTTEACFKLSPIPLTEEEEQFINSLKDETATFVQFKKICPYLRGRHHVEEIMWRENITRDDFNKISEKFSQHLIIVHR
uniref:GATOR1 complex protein NPRL3 C-terminal HTH domain-containing protein n=1 Tax=Arcella intermedia TaxID=1963864 RepID=A0A6B2L715_9EUKA